jgi:DNA end-binding protein Ku
LVDEVTRAVVEAEDKGRGYEYAKNSYVMIDDDELEAVEIESSKTIDIDAFVPRAQIDERYFNSTYYVVPEGKVGQEAFTVIREAMRDKKMAALARVVLNKREHVMMLQPWDKGIMGTTLRYPYEVRKSEDLFSEIEDFKIAPDMMKLADHIVESKAADFDPSQFRDRYEDAVVELIRTKRAGLPAAPQRISEAAPNVVSLMDALKRSLAEGTRTPAAPRAEAETVKARPKKAPKRASGQSEMLLPIAGKGPKRATEKPAAKAPARPTKRKKTG